LLLLAFGHLAPGQPVRKSCNCPEGQDLAHQGEPDKVFTLSNGQQIGVCGDVEKIGADTIYSEVILYHCGHDGFFRGWDGIKTCKIYQDQDTIIVQQLFNLPVGENMQIITTTFRTEKYFYRGARFVTRSVYRVDLKPYTTSQIEDVLGQYTRLKKGDHAGILQTARRLCWAHISGSNEAGIAFDNLYEKFSLPETGISDEMDQLHGLYWFWKLDHGRTQKGLTELPVP